MKQSVLAAERFGAVANTYLSSAVHATGEDLQRLVEVARTLGQPETLDVGCGAGHASFAVAACGTSVTAYDISDEMLAVVADEAKRRGLDRLRTRQGPAEELPFDDACFGLVVTRFSAHHWSRIDAALGEMRRVLRPGGTLIVIDAVAPEEPALDTVLQAVEVLRDPSHVRDYRISEWSSMLERAAFSRPDRERWTLRMQFESWIARMRTPDLRARAIRSLFDSVAEEARRHFNVGDDGSFDLDVAWFRTS
jgi:ubiquinone/menaquinone biosynthesis C-methylase UbiE